MEVSTERIYQVRNADISNMTIIEGDTGLIVVDPLISAENAAAALKLYYVHRPRKPVKYVIYSHSHIDHYGGVEGVTSAADAHAGKVGILAPQGFMEAAVAENVMAGTDMTRRAMFMYGTTLPPSPTGHVGAGLGLKNSCGSRGLIPPTDVIARDGERRTLDGLTFIFLLAPGTEAPAEMHRYIPELKALTAAENCVHTLHNLYTLRGAKTREPLNWAQALDHVVFADPANREARELEANALEQLGYQAESGPWRNFCLTGARERLQSSGGTGRRQSGAGPAEHRLDIPAHDRAVLHLRGHSLVRDGRGAAPAFLAPGPIGENRAVSTPEPRHRRLSPSGL